MPSKSGGVLLIILLTAVAAVCDGGATVLSLTRVFPVNKTVEVEILKARDRVRHARVLQSGGVVDFDVFGTSDPYYGGLDGGFVKWVLGKEDNGSDSLAVQLADEKHWDELVIIILLLYYTKVKLGSPPREFNVQIDTGSDVLWVTCSSCIDCPNLSSFGIPLNMYDAASSSTASLVSCSDSVCSSSIRLAEASCSDEDNQCHYEFHYADNSGTSGHYVTDLLYFDTVVDPSMITNSSASITFGCSTYQYGSLTSSEKAMDGIFGFGQRQLSVISQLAAQGITPKVFSHCLRGDGNGGGKFVLGEITAPNMVYSPLVPSQPHYNLDLQSISVGEQLLPIDASVFATSDNQGTIIDTGTTLTYLIAPAYDSFVDAITAAVSQLVVAFSSKDAQCYLVKSSINLIFPKVSLNFAGGASMNLKPENYLVLGDPVGAGIPWCIGFQKSNNAVTVLGDLVLKDKIFVYDLSRKRIGWTDYDCSADVNVSIKSNKNEYLNAGRLNASMSSWFTSLKVLLVCIFWSLLG